MIPRNALLSLAFLAALVACAPQSGTERLSAGATVDIASAGTQLAFQRAGGGIIRPLSHSPQLQAVAEEQAQNLNVSNSMGQIGAGGTALSDRLRRAGYTACASAENTATGTSDIRSTLANWMSNPDQRANILNPQVTQFGFAGAGDTWVLVLARPC